ERLRMMEHRNVFEIGFGDDSPEIVPPGKKKRFANMRAFMWAGEMKDWLTRGCIDPNDKKLAAQLAAPGFHFQQSGALVLESKEQMAKRRVASPDEADALCLSFARSVAPLEAPVTPLPPRSGNAYGWMG